MKFSEATKLSDMLRLAIKDYRACIADPNYVINMTDWHIPITQDGEKLCSVCLAGAVMAKTCKALPSYYYVASDHDICSQLRVLDRLRSGDISYTEDLGIEVSEVHCNEYEELFRNCDVVLAPEKLDEMLQWLVDHDY